MKKIYALLIALFLVNGVLAQTDQPCSTCLPEGIAFTTQDQIDSFQINYPGCTEILGGVTIDGSDQPVGDITNLNGLSVLTSIGNDLLIDGNQALTSLTGLDNLIFVGGSVQIGKPCYFPSQSGNWALTSLTGLDNLTSIGGNLEISCNLFLTSLTGLEKLTTIGGMLAIGYEGMGNGSLTTLTALENLTSVGGMLLIQGNDLLVSLTGLDNIEANTILSLGISWNFYLSNCAVQSICDYLASPNGQIDINDNAPGCNSQQEVEDSCASVGVRDLNLEALLTIYPNPVSTTITIETPAKGLLSIHNTNGLQLLDQEAAAPTTTIDVSGWKSGVYLVKVVGEKGVSVGKFVKQ